MAVIIPYDGRVVDSSQKVLAQRYSNTMQQLEEPFLYGEKHFNETIASALGEAENLGMAGAHKEAADIEERCKYLRSKSVHEHKMDYFSGPDEKEANMNPKDTSELVKEVNNYFNKVSFC